MRSENCNGVDSFSCERDYCSVVWRVEWHLKGGVRRISSPVSAAVVVMSIVCVVKIERVRRGT